MSDEKRERVAVLAGSFAQFQQFIRSVGTEEDPIRITPRGGETKRAIYTYVTDHASVMGREFDSYRTIGTWLGVSGYAEVLEWLLLSIHRTKFAETNTL